MEYQLPSLAPLNGTFYVYDAYGRQVHTGALSAMSGSLVLDDLSPGLYYFTYPTPTALIRSAGILVLRSK